MALTRTGGVSVRYLFRASAIVLFLTAAAPVAMAGTLKIAFYNIKSGRGEVGLPGHPVVFADTPNCSDRTKPLNAWGVGLVQAHLVSRVRNDSAVVAVGLAEAWRTVCGSPERVRAVLGWRAASSERNGTAIVAKFGFAGPEEWQQLDSSANLNPADTRWVLRVPVCAESACARSLLVYTAHWGADGPYQNQTFIRQSDETMAFIKATAGAAPHVLIGDFNVWEASSQVCGQLPPNVGLDALRGAGYIDAWPHLHALNEGYTGMTNRRHCGVPEGYVWKRIDYAWSPHWYPPVSVKRFGKVAPGDASPSDHYGLIVEYPR